MGQTHMQEAGTILKLHLRWRRHEVVEIDQ
jgi:hypothetical protein